MKRQVTERQPVPNIMAALGAILLGKYWIPKFVGMRVHSKIKKKYPICSWEKPKSFESLGARIGSMNENVKFLKARHPQASENRGVLNILRYEIGSLGSSLS